MGRTMTARRTRLTLTALLAVASMVLAAPADASARRGVSSSGNLVDLSAELNVTDGAHGFAAAAIGGGRSPGDLPRVGLRPGTRR